MQKSKSRFRARRHLRFRFAKESELEGTAGVRPALSGVLDPLIDSGELAKLIKVATGDWDREVILTDEPFVGLRAMNESWANRFSGGRPNSASWSRNSAPVRTHGLTFSSQHLNALFALFVEQQIATRMVASESVKELF
jgi:hypothetical protein